MYKKQILAQNPASAAWGVNSQSTVLHRLPYQDTKTRKKEEISGV